MTREKLSKLIKHPRTSEADVIPALEEIVARYPYYTNGHLLLTLQYHQLDHIRYESQLRKTAVHVPDRSVLRKLVLMQEDEVSAVESSPEVMPLPIDIKSEPVAHPPLEIVVDSPANDNPPSETPKIVKLDPREVIEQRLQELKQQEQFVRAKVIEQTGLDKPIVVPIKKADEPMPIHQTSEPIKETVVPKLAEVQIEQVRAVKPELPTAPTKPATDNIAPREGKRSFSDWIKQTAQQTISPAKSIPFEPATDYFALETSSQLLTEPPNKADLPKADLIDKFIREEPRIVPAKSEFYSPGNMARKSAQEHEDLISETLARIYAQQGNIAKAIATYERLALKLPQKKTYFASLIEKLKEQA